MLQSHARRRCRKESFDANPLAAATLVSAALAGNTTGKERTDLARWQFVMQELMTNPQVAGTLASIEKYADRTRIDATLRQ